MNPVPFQTDKTGSRMNTPTPICFAPVYLLVICFCIHTHTHTHDNCNERTCICKGQFTFKSMARSILKITLGQ